MANLLTLALLTSTVTFGFYKATRYHYDMVEQSYKRREALSFLSIYIDNLLPYWITKPLYNCPPCMGSVWGLGAGILAGVAWFHIPVLMLSISGINYILIRLFPYTDD